jgi:hypothetical protein
MCAGRTPVLPILAMVHRFLPPSFLTVSLRDGHTFFRHIRDLQLTDSVTIALFNASDNASAGAIIGEPFLPRNQHCEIPSHLYMVKPVTNFELTHPFAGHMDGVRKTWIWLQENCIARLSCVWTQFQYQINSEWCSA